MAQVVPGVEVEDSSRSYSDALFPDWIVSASVELDEQSDEMGIHSIAWNLNVFGQIVGGLADWNNTSRKSSEMLHIPRLHDCCLNSVEVNEGAHRFESTIEKQPWPFGRSPCRLLDGKYIVNSTSAAVTNAEFFQPKYEFANHDIMTDFDVLAYRSIEKEPSTTELPADFETPARIPRNTLWVPSNRRTVRGSMLRAEEESERYPETNRCHSLSKSEVRQGRSEKSDVDQESMSRTRISVAMSSEAGGAANGNAKAKIDREENRRLQCKRRKRLCHSVSISPVLAELRRSQSESSLRRRYVGRTRSKSQGGHEICRRNSSADNFYPGVCGRHTVSAFVCTCNGGECQQMEEPNDAAKFESERTETSIAVFNDNVKAPYIYRASSAATGVLYRGREQTRRGQREAAATETPTDLYSRTCCAAGAAKDKSESYSNFSFDDSSSVVSDCSLKVETDQTAEDFPEPVTLDKISLWSRQAERCAEPVRRDLRVLLRENIAVTLEDLERKENRRLLHILVFEHKLGKSIRALKKTVKAELANDPENTLRTQPPQRLYVAPPYLDN